MSSPKNSLRVTYAYVAQMLLLKAVRNMHISATFVLVTMTAHLSLALNKLKANPSSSPVCPSSAGCRLPATACILRFMDFADLALTLMHCVALFPLNRPCSLLLLHREKRGYELLHQSLCAAVVRLLAFRLLALDPLPGLQLCLVICDILPHYIVSSTC